MIGGKQYPRIKYFIVLLIVMGVGLFLYKDKKDGQKQESEVEGTLFDYIGFGEILVVSVVRDGWSLYKIQ